MIAIYSPKESARLAYVLDEVFTRRAKVTYRLYTTPQDYQSAPESVKINYSPSILDGIQVLPEGLLWETGIRTKSPEPSLRGDYAILFPNATALGFDIFSMIFWFLSRMEEYNEHPRDQHDRFGAFSSRIFRQINPDIPHCDLAVRDFFQLCDIHWVQNYSVFPTIDIDIAYKYLGKPWHLQLGAIVRDICTGNIKTVSHRLAVIRGVIPDPWDTYDYITKTTSKFASQTRVFIQCGKRSTFDKNISPGLPEFQRLIQHFTGFCELGLHPSYHAGNNVALIKSEKAILESFLPTPVVRSRQHFLRLDFPETYHHLQEAGIGHDYTMGFADRSGYRAATACSFRFFDLMNNASGNIVIHPFCFMDVTLKKYMMLNQTQAMNKVAELKYQCQKNNLPFSFIFHNESLSEEDEWTGWRKVFEACLN